MAPSSQLLRDFQDSGPLSAWIAVLVLITAAVAVGGWSAWLGRFAQLLAGYAFVHLALAATRRFGGELPTGLTLTVLPSLAALAGLVSTIAFRAANESADILNGDFSFDVGVSTFFTFSVAALALGQREAEHRRNTRLALVLESETRERQVAELRLNLLQAQIEPHFIYNTLANVQQLVRTSPADADHMLESLIRYLKAAIPEVRSGTSNVGQELARAQAYLAIMRIRMGERLRYEINVPQELHALRVPPLGLMTLVENAVKHGLDAKREGGLVRIEGERVGESFHLSVIDDGAGFSEDAGDGTGLSNLRERIATLHGERGTLELSHRDPSGVKATLVLPCE
jgi:two-component sensor histidine kinase